MSSNKLTDAEIIDIYTEIKNKLASISYEYREKDYHSDDYSKIINILMKAFVDTLPDFEYRIGKTAPFTGHQKNYICYQIGEWYLQMKPLLEGRHNLGYMKEKLKTMICGD